MLILLPTILLFDTIICYPAEENDTPIHKITIRPTVPSNFTQTTSYANMNRGRKIENGATVIKVFKKTTEDSKESSPQYKKYQSKTPTNSTDANTIFLTRAKVNGSFRQSPLNRSRDAKQWTVYKLKPANRIHVKTLETNE